MLVPSVLLSIFLFQCPFIITLGLPGAHAFGSSLNSSLPGARAFGSSLNFSLSMSIYHNTWSFWCSCLRFFSQLPFNMTFLLSLVPTTSSKYSSHFLCCRVLADVILFTVTSVCHFVNIFLHKYCMFVCYQQFTALVNVTEMIPLRSGPYTTSVGQATWQHNSE